MEVEKYWYHILPSSPLDVSAFKENRLKIILNE